MKNTRPLSIWIDSEKFLLQPTKEKELFTPDETVSVEIEQSGTNYTYRKMRIFNPTDKNSKRVSNIRAADISIKCNGEVKLHALRGECNGGKESFLPNDRILNEGDSWTIHPEGARSSSNYACPFFDLSFDGKALLVAPGWTGQWIATFSVKDGYLNVSVGLMYADFYLKPHESLDLLSVFIAEGEDASELRRRIRRFLLDNSPINHLDNKLPISTEHGFIGFYCNRSNPELASRWTTYQTQSMLIDASKRCKYIDTYWMDAWWFREGFPHGVGNYNFCEGFSEGLMPVSNEAHENGMKFMVWFEPERIYEGSDLYKYKQDFLLKVEDPTTFLFNLCDEEAWNWLYSTLSRMIRENGIDYYRQDANINPLEYCLANDEEGRQGVMEIRYINALYRLWDKLREEFPDLLIDNCASGGRRIDLESSLRSVPLWRTDGDCKEPIHPTYPEYPDVWSQNHTISLSEYVPHHATGVWDSLANSMRSGATSGVACNFDFLTADNTTIVPDFDFTKAEAALEEVVRFADYWKGDFYPLSESTLDETIFAGWQLARENDGCALLFRRKNCADDTFVFMPRAIKTDAEYEITLSDEHYEKSVITLSGAEFSKGLAIVIPEPHSSVSVEYKTI